MTESFDEAGPRKIAKLVRVAVAQYLIEPADPGLLCRSCGGAIDEPLYTIRCPRCGHMYDRPQYLCRCLSCDPPF